MIEVSALWRHPIKSHGREALTRVTLQTGQTMPWDRTWAVTHEATKFDEANPEWSHCTNFMLGSRTPKLAAIWATLDEESRRITLRHADLEEITFNPDDKSDIPRFLAWVTPLSSAGRVLPETVVSVEGRGMTDSPFPSVSIMNEASHLAVQDALGTPIGMERWRGNIWLNGLTPWAEHDWLGRDIQIGGATLRIAERIRRCTVTNTNPVTGIRDTETLNALNTTFGHQDFGVYAEVIKGGEITLGAEATLI